MLIKYSFNKDEIIQILRRYLIEENNVYENYRYDNNGNNVEITGYSLGNPLEIDNLKIEFTYEEEIRIRSPR